MTNMVRSSCKDNDDDDDPVERCCRAYREDENDIDDDDPGRLHHPHPPSPLWLPSSRTNQCRQPKASTTSTTSPTSVILSSWLWTGIMPVESSWKHSPVVSSTKMETTMETPSPPPQQQQQPYDLLSMIGSFDSQSDTADIHHHHHPTTGSEIITPPPYSHSQHSHHHHQHRSITASTTRPKPRRCYIFYDSDTDTESDSGHNRYQQQQEADDDEEEAFDDDNHDDHDDHDNHGAIFHYKRRLFVDTIDAPIPPITSTTSITSTITSKATIKRGHEDMSIPVCRIPKGTTNVVSPITITTSVRPRVFSFRRAQRKQNTRGGTFIPVSSPDDDTPPTPLSTPPPPPSQPHQYRISNIAAQAIANIYQFPMADDDATAPQKYWSHEYLVHGSATTGTTTTLLLRPNGQPSSKDDGASIREFDMAGNDDTTDSVSSSSSSTTSSSSSPSNHTHLHDEHLRSESIIAAPTCGRTTTASTGGAPHVDIVVSRSMPHSIDHPLHCRIQSVTSLLVHDFDLLSTVSTSSITTTPTPCAKPTTAVTRNTSQCTSRIGTDHNDRCWYDRKLWIRNPIVTYLILPQW